MQEDKRLGAPLSEVNMDVPGARGEQRRVGRVANDSVPYDAEDRSPEMAPMSNLPVRETVTLSALRELAVAGRNNSVGSAPSPAATPGSIAKDPVANNTSKQTAAAPAADSTSRPFVPSIGTTYAKAATVPITKEGRDPQTALLSRHVGNALEAAGTNSSSSETPGVVQTVDDGTDREEPGRIVMNGACFRWTNKVAGNEHMNVLGRLN